MAFYCNGKMGVCEENRTGCSMCDYLDGSGGKEIPDAPLTHADRIRAMSDEELAWELMTWRIETCARLNGAESPYPHTQKSILEWLKQPAKEGEDDALSEM